MSRPSSIGWPNIDTKIGVAAVSAAATRPARAPSQRSTTTDTASVVTAPSTTCGRPIAAADMPKRCTLIAWGTAKPASLSSVTVASGSKEPERKAGRDSDMDRTALA